MKKAFSLIELAMVIFIIAILSIIGYTMMPNYTLINDTNFIAMQIKRVQSNSIGNSHFVFNDGGAWRGGNYPNSCITIDKSSLQVQKASSGGYSIHAQTSINISGLLQGTQNRVCFDDLGRVYDNNYNNLITADNGYGDVNITITYKNEVKNILIMPYSGYVIIE